MVQEKTRDTSRASGSDEVNVDTEWFRRQLERSGKTSNGLARHLGIAGSQTSRMLNGQRKMRASEAPKVARFIGVPTDEVMRRAGLLVPEAADKPMTAQRYVGADGKLVATDPVELPADLVARARDAVPYDQMSSVNAALIRAPKGALSLWDDALVLYDTIGAKPPEMGVLSIAQLRDGVVMMGRIQSVKKTGEAVIEMADGEKRTVDLVGAAKVLNVIP